MGKEDAKEEIKRLIEKFQRLSPEGKESYNEANTKKDFILPLFRALGWNTSDKDEVAAEEKAPGKRVDYAFKINGISKFFLEAKAIKEDIGLPKWAEQATNYSWLKGVTWAVLTDFEGLRVFNAEIKAKNPLELQWFSLRWDQYLDSIDQLWLLSKESFEQGLIDKAAVKWGGKRLRKSPIDKQLLHDFTVWRTLLSKDILRRNQSEHLTEEQLDESVQRILDRLMFIRNCEDRQLEQQELISNLREWETTRKGALFRKIQNLFRYFDKQYNSKIFQEHLCDKLEIGNEVLKEIIEGLYRTKDKTISYDFSVISADVLGAIYEQYLGHILKKTAKRAKLEAGKARRKAMGIYYTPTYIVDYIVKNTLGELLKEGVVVKKIKVLDPACGSGSFLIKAFDYINDYYKKRKKEKSEQTKLDVSDGGVLFSTRTNILKNNLFGVDLDPRAVEIAQLNLLLKVAERRHRLPLLQESIKCGNSLIDDPKVAGDKAFKWEEQFREVMDEGGFDVVVGNPPWVQSKFLPEEDKRYYSNKYEVAKKQYDLFTIFIERALQKLKDDGILGFITPDRFISNLDYWPFREFLLNNCKILKIIRLGDDVFPEVNMPSAILIVKREKSKTKRDNGFVEYAMRTDEKLLNVKYYEKKQSEFLQNEGFVFSIFSTGYLGPLLRKIKGGSVAFREVVDNARGVEIGKNSKLIADKKLDEKYAKFLIGEDIGRYRLTSRRYIRLGERGVDYKEPGLYKSPKILIRKTGLGIKAMLDMEDHYVIQVIYIFKTKKGDVDERYLLGIINSSLIEFYHYSIFGEKSRKTFPHLTQGKVLQLPIKIVPASQQQPLIKLVDKMLSLNKRLNELGDKKTDERARIEEEIKRTDEKIDELVYKLYGITEKEKKIIEESLKN